MKNVLLNAIASMTKRWFNVPLIILARGVLVLIVALGMSTISLGQIVENITTIGAGTWIVPVGTSGPITVEAWGAGGSGGGASGSSRGGSGGTGGTYVIRTYPEGTYTPGVTTYDLFVAGSTTGGAAGSNGSNGAATWFESNAIVFAPGGKAGLAGNGAAVTALATGAIPAAGAVYGAATLAGSGGVGSSGSSGANGGGDGGNGVNASNGVSTNGNPGTAAGGGGSGGATGGGACGACAATGGAGAPGQIRISYYQSPTITSFLPTGLTSACSQTVTITGTNLLGASSVTFNGVSAASFVVNSNSQITVITPIGVTAGAITVTTPGGSVDSAPYSVEVFPPLDPVSAGPNQILAACAVSTALAGSAVPEFGVGTWSVVSGSASITSPHSATSSVSGLVLNASVTLRWTVTLGCETLFSDVTITTVTGAGCNDERLYEVNGTLFNHTIPFTVPADVTTITVECWGAGGGGGYSRTFGRPTAGGGGGAYARSALTVSPGAVFTVGVGLGGEGPGHTLTIDDAAQRPGGPSFLRNSSDVDVVLATGGISARNNRTDQPGAGGQASGCIFNDVAYSGGNGSPGVDAVRSGAGGGGAGTNGPGANAVAGNGGSGGASLGGNGANAITSNNNDGISGSNYGGGGSGAWRGSGGGTTEKDGGAGAIGFVRITYISALPVKLISFTAQCKNDIVTLKWSTASENNASHYSLQSSRDGSTWIEVAEIAAAGTTNQTTNYSYEDIAFGGISYYRLVQIDFDGTSTIFGPISVNCEINESSITVYPNPTDSDFNVLIQTTERFENASLELVDLSGRVVHVKNMNILPGVTVVKFETTNFNPGTYIVRVKGENNKFMPIRLVVM
jgi:hypothetical protein